MTDPDLCDTDPTMILFSEFLIALHELGRLSGTELADWQEGVATALDKLRRTEAETARSRPARRRRALLADA